MNSKRHHRFGGKARSVFAAILEHVVADESRLAATMRDFTWRVRGSPMQSMNRLFAEQGRQIDRWLAELAAKARAVGIAFSAKDRGESADAQELAERNGVRDRIGQLLALHERLAEQLGSDLAVLEDDGADREAAGLLEGLRDFHETAAWMLRVLLESPEPALAR
jgi:DNA-binding ferritin-like protein